MSHSRVVRFFRFAKCRTCRVVLVSVDEDAGIDHHVGVYTLHRKMCPKATGTYWIHPKDRAWLTICIPGVDGNDIAVTTMKSDFCCVPYGPDT